MCFLKTQTIKRGQTDKFLLMKNKTKNLIGGLMAICGIAGLATSVAYYEEKANSIITKNVCSYSQKAEKEMKDGKLEDALKIIKEGKQYILNVQKGNDDKGNTVPAFRYEFPFADVSDGIEYKKLCKMEEIVKGYSKIAETRK
jgi:hypothetical protein